MRAGVEKAFIRGGFLTTLGRVPGGIIEQVDRREPLWLRHRHERNPR